MSYGLDGPDTEMEESSLVLSVMVLLFSTMPVSLSVWQRWERCDYDKSLLLEAGRNRVNQRRDWAYWEGKEERRWKKSKLAKTVCNSVCGRKEKTPGVKVDRKGGGGDVLC